MNTNDILKLIKERRSYRKFLDKQIPKKDLNQLIDIIKHCPTNRNVQDTRLTIIQDKEKIIEISNITTEFFKIQANIASQSFHKTEAEQRLIDYGIKLDEIQSRGVNPIFYNTPVVLIFHTEKDCCQRKNNCVIASTVVSMAARTMGLESTYMGLFEYASQTYKEIWKAINLPETDQIYSAIILGYPSYKYPNDIERKPINVTRL